jgi:hypothetical protein
MINPTIMRTPFAVHPGKPREFYIPDFTNWKDHEAFEAKFSNLLRDLRVKGRLKELASRTGVEPVSPP